MRFRRAIAPALCTALLAACTSQSTDTGSQHSSAAGTSASTASAAPRSSAPVSSAASRSVSSSSQSSISLPQGWSLHTDDVTGMSFAYPPNRLSVRTDQTVIRLRHSVPWTHPDPCDFKGDAPQLQALTDFNVSFEVVESTLLPAITRTEGSDYIVKEFFPDGRFTPRDDSFVTAANMGTLSGYHVYSGIEGCGRHAYYFPTPTGRTLVVLRQFIAEFNPVNGDTDQVRALSGVILPDVEDQLFVKVMESVRFRQ